MNRAAFTYMMSNKSHTLYVGATRDLIQRVRQHKQKIYPSAFTARYNFDRLVWYESWPTFEEAEREQRIKSWSRARCDRRIVFILRGDAGSPVQQRCVWVRLCRCDRRC